MTDRLIIFDTTLRDGEQSPGASMTKEEKLRIAKQLERLRVDVIEAGFRRVVQRRLRSGAFDRQRGQGLDRLLAGARQRSRHQSRCRGARGRAVETDPYVHRHIGAAHGKETAHDARSGVRAGRARGAFARQFTDDVEFSPEDGYRSEPDFLCRVLEAVIAKARRRSTFRTPSATRCRNCTASSCATARRIPNSGKAIWSVHCHNDLGMAVANSLAGVKIGGARQVECTVNGLGERAGNCSLEEVVMAVKTRRDFFGLDVRVDTTQIVPASKLVSGITGFPVQPNKAVVGANAFAHASGIHQDGVLKARDTYEIMRAEDVGWHANKIVLGKLSGRNAFKQRVNELAIPVESESEWNAAFARFKELADSKSEIYDEDIQALFSDERSRRTTSISS
jgi:2-isopropylmalate synthase